MPAIAIGCYRRRMIIRSIFVGLVGVLLLAIGACQEEPTSAEVIPSPARVATGAPVEGVKDSAPVERELKDSDLAGSYRIGTGLNPDGSAYDGTVKIKASGDTYTLDWTAAGRAYQGLGIARRGVLGASWGVAASGGVVVYEIDGGTLRGVWAPQRGTKLGMENLEGPKSLTGKFQITEARSVQGVKYAGSVAISREGDGYRFFWTLSDGSTYDGIGLKHGDVMVVAWPSSGAGVVAYAVNGKRLEGKWAQRGGEVGSETLVR